MACGHEGRLRGLGYDLLGRAASLPAHDASIGDVIASAQRIGDRGIHLGRSGADGTTTAIRLSGASPGSLRG